MDRSRVSLSALVLAGLAIGCGGNADPGTSIRLAVTYDDALGLDDAEVEIAARRETGPAAHELLLLVADDAVDQELAIAVWGRKAGARVAYGTVVVTPKRGVVVPAQLALATCVPGCDGDQLRACGPPVSCALGCSTVDAPHCVTSAVSNGVDTTVLDQLSEPIIIADNTVIDGDTGEISGGLARAAGTGVDAGIAYFRQPSGGQELGVFAFHDLIVAGRLRITGSRPVVLLVGDTVTVTGVIDLAAGRLVQATPGPGGGRGGNERDDPDGCGPGGAGMRGGIDDSGGGGGGASEQGGLGGPSGASQAVAGGARGAACFAPELEPLVGGSGGGKGGRGSNASAASGGGGGGALQITALGSLEVTGTIDACGAGGELGAPGNGNGDAGGGGGGGAGGAILLEAPMVTVTSTAIVVANGGGGGGGGGPGPNFGGPGENGVRDVAPAMGGPGAAPDNPTNNGGSGGAEGSPPDFGSMGVHDGGAGGGAAGAIVIRGSSLSVAGTISPNAKQLDVHPRR